MSGGALDCPSRGEHCASLYCHGTGGGGAFPRELKGGTSEREGVGGGWFLSFGQEVCPWGHNDKSWREGESREVKR